MLYKVANVGIFHVESRKRAAPHVHCVSNTSTNIKKMGSVRTSTFASIKTLTKYISAKFETVKHLHGVFVLTNEKRQ